MKKLLDVRSNFKKNAMQNTPLLFTGAIWQLFTYGKADTTIIKHDFFFFFVSVVNYNSFSSKQYFFRRVLYKMNNDGLKPN